MSKSRKTGQQAEASAVADADGLERDLEELLDALEPYSISLSSGSDARIRVFARELVSWNDRHNLLSRMDVHNVIRKHVAASLGVLLIADPIGGQRWIDVGTGAGFPGMILKLALPELDITLVDSSKKRCAFLDHVSRTIDLNTAVLPMRAEAVIAHRGGKKAFDVVTSRAVASLQDSVRAFSPLLAPGGLFVTFKGPGWKEELAVAAEGGALEQGRVTFESVTRVPWTQAHLVTLRAAT